MLLGFLLIAVLLALSGVLALIASRHDAATATAPGLAMRVQDGIGRTAAAVDLLVDKRPAEEVLRRAREVDPDQQRTTYLVMGAGMVGLAVVLVLGIVLVLAG